MKEASERLKQFLFNNQVFYIADLFRIIMTNGVELYYTNCDLPLKVDGKTFKVLQIERTGTKQNRGISVDEVNLNITVDKTDVIPGGLSFMQGVINGSFENSLLQIDRVFSPTPFKVNMPPIDKDYVLCWWKGIFNVDSAGGNVIEATASSMTQLLNVKFPRNLYYPPCIYTLGDSGCGIDLSKFKVKGRVISATRGNIKTDLNLTDGYLKQGSITFLSGINTNVTRNIRNNGAEGINVVLPFQSSPEVGDLLEVAPACDKSMNCCKYRFNNIEKFRGYPFIPVPETAY